MGERRLSGSRDERRQTNTVVADSLFPQRVDARLQADGVNLPWA